MGGEETIGFDRHYNPSLGTKPGILWNNCRVRTIWISRWIIFQVDNFPEGEHTFLGPDIRHCLIEEI